MWKKKKVFFIALALCTSLGLTFMFLGSKKSKQPHLTVIGPLNMADGLGRQSAELIDAVKDEVVVNFIPTSKKLDLTDTPKGIRKILKNRHVKFGKVIIYEECFGVSEEYVSQHLKQFKNDKQIRIAYSMFEASLIPSSWVTILNQYFDAVAVPDKFLIEVYKNSGVTIPIFEIPLGLNLDAFLSRPLKASRNKPFVFANLSTSIQRKNHLKLIQAFHQAFGNSPEVKLRLNSRYGDGAVKQLIKNEIEKYQLTNVEYTEKSLHNDLYLSVFEEVDCYVSLSTGEGFSIQPREAMALGIPSIVTDNTGQSTICGSNLVRTVPSANATPAYFPFLNGHFGDFYDCNLEDAVAALKDVYEHYDQYLEKGTQARKWVMQYRFATLKPFYMSLIKPKKIVLGRENKMTADCLTTDSQALYEKYQKLLNTKI